MSMRYTNTSYKLYGNEYASNKSISRTLHVPGNNILIKRSANRKIADQLMRPMKN